MPVGHHPSSPEGILLVDKPSGKTSFSLVAVLRRLLGVKKIGHAGTLDPFATGVMVMLIGKHYTTQSNQFLLADKEYNATLHLGIETDSYDCDGIVKTTSDFRPSEPLITSSLTHFQGEIMQIPPMFSAKKREGKKLYELARQGIQIPRDPVAVRVDIKFIDYQYPHLELHIRCSKGTYIRSLAHDLGKMLGCGAHLSALRRLRSGEFKSDACLDGSLLYNGSYSTEMLLKHLIQNENSRRS